MRTNGFLKAFWALTKPYWVSQQRRKALTLLATVIGLALGLVWMDVLFNYWNRDFYNTFETRDQAEFFRQFGKFTLLAVIYIVMWVYRAWFLQMLQIEWRTWLTDHFMRDWMHDQAYYRMQLLDRGTDNPDQRIAEDLRIFVEFTSDLTIGLLTAVARLGSFVVIRWTLSGAAQLWGISIPGYLVWIALIYAIAGSLLTHVIGRRLIPLEFTKQRVEADFRFGLVRMRENSEGVALYRGEGEELGGLRQRFGAVIGNWWQLMRKRKQVNWFASFYDQAAIIFPYLVVAPRFFAGTIPLGVIFQTASAFRNVQDALSWFINVYQSFATWKATVDRLIGFHAALERVRADAARIHGERTETSDERIVLENMKIELPQGRPLLNDAAIELKPNEDVLISGPSGAGKSTFFRALAGIWPYWRGRIQLPQGARLLFLPQKAYLPLGSLKHAVSYPDEPATYSDEQVRSALQKVALGHLAGDLERTENWAQVLSGGEQQRLAFARALLNKPDWLFLDEATASLPEEDQAALYRLLKEELAGTTLVSIGHRDSLAAFHDKRLVWQEKRLAFA